MNSHSDDLKKIQEQLNKLVERQDLLNKDLDKLKLEIMTIAGNQKPESIGVKTPANEEKYSPDAVQQESLPEVATPNKFYRSASQKIFGGVAAGLAAYLNVSPLLIRFAWVLLTFMYCVGPLAYIILWVVVPRSPFQPKPLREMSRTGTNESKPEASTTIAHPDLQETVKTEPKEAVPSTNLEKYIGQNLISKIGIAILVIGVGLGVKYSIDNDLLSPVFRVLGAYLIGGALTFFAWRLKRNHKNLSAVMLSGAFAIMYFTTFVSFAFYELFPPTLAFMLMLLFTILAVLAALKYNIQIIAHIGMVGAYALPFLLKNDSGTPALLFGYMGIINVGILALSFYKYWKALYKVSFGITWIIFLIWYAAEMQPLEHTFITWTFLIAFFLIFYLAFLAHKLKSRKEFDIQDIILILSNIFIFYGIGTHLLLLPEDGQRYLGLFTLANAVPSAILSLIILKLKGADKNVGAFFTGISLLFISLSIPIQLDGNWVTLLWIGEAAILFQIGRSKALWFFEKLAFYLIAVSFVSLLQDWTPSISQFNNPPQAWHTRAFWNSEFLTALIFSGVLGYINLLNNKGNEKRKNLEGQQLEKVLNLGLSGMFLFVLFLSVSIEISRFWNGLGASQSNLSILAEIEEFKILSVMNYGFVFLSTLAVLNIKKVRSESLGVSTLLLTLISMFLFLTHGTASLDTLKDLYLSGDTLASSSLSPAQIGIRYISFLFMTGMIVAGLRLSKSGFMKTSVSVAASFKGLILAVIIGWILTSELMYWLDWNKIPNADKLWVSILWGFYALGIIVFGIWKKNKPIRIVAIILFSLTLIKLFVYDIAHLNTISKTLVFFVLGALLLIISYLYNRFKNMI